MRRPFVLLALVALLATVPAAADGNVGPGPVPTRSLPGALIWGNGIFSNRAEFGRWLQKRHHVYASWSKQHPLATSILAAAEAPPVRFLPSQLAPHGAAPVVVPLETAGPPASFPLVPLFIALGLALVVIAALPYPAIAPRWAFGEVVYRNRLALVGIGVTLAAAVVVAKLAA